MDGFKEFTGKDLDNAIEEACGYFDAPREKLEIEIIQDSKSGIFGIVGARKAKIRARRAPLRETVQNLLGKKKDDARQKHGDSPQKEETRQPVQAKAAARAEKTREEPREQRKEPAKSREGRQPRAEAPRKTQEETAREEPAPRKSQPAKNAPAEFDSAPQERQERGNGAILACHEDELEELPVRSLDELDHDSLVRTVTDVVERLMGPVAGQPLPVKVEIHDGRVRAKVEWSGDAGLLIGREGQTLQAIQYLASRLVSRKMEAAIRVQLDIGEYRARQEDKLRGMAKMLAERARQSGKSFSTRPLSSYHRRIIHLCLQDMPDITTRSSGDGSLKRVVISARRQEKS